MILGVVVGRVYSTINHPFYDNRRLLLVDRIAPDSSRSGGYLLAVDAVGSGAGETVLIVDEGNSARQVLGDRTAPVRSVIVGIVDAIDTP
jgi:ethanolamine utilization protein EutN